MEFLAELQLRLNKDVRLKEEFLEDPVAMLERAGLTLSREAKKELVDLVKKLEMPRPQGASGRKEARARSLLIGIKATDDPSHPPEPEKTK